MITARACGAPAGCLSLGLLSLLAFTGCAHTRRGAADAQSYRAERNREASVLIAHETADNLAAAALLLSPDARNAREPLDLIERAEALAPRRPELVWVHLAICERLGCEARPRIAARLQALDPDNGFAWVSDLGGAQSSSRSEAVTASIERIGSAPRMTLYWNELEVMLVDALAVANPSESLARRGVDAAGILGSETIPPLQPISRPCRLEKLDLAGRRAACQAMLARMEHSSTLLTQSLALTLQARWWPSGSPQRAAARAKQRRIDYLITESGRIRWWRADHDMAVRIAAARRTDREDDVALTVLKSLGMPPEPPADWKDPLHNG